MRPPRGFHTPGGIPTAKNVMQTLLNRELANRTNAHLKRKHYEHTMRNFRLRCTADSHKLDADKPIITTPLPLPRTAADIAGDQAAARLSLLLSPSRPSQVGRPAVVVPLTATAIASSGAAAASSSSAAAIAAVAAPHTTPVTAMTAAGFNAAMNGPHEPAFVSAGGSTATLPAVAAAAAALNNVMNGIAPVPASAATTVATAATAATAAAAAVAAPLASSSVSSSSSTTRLLRRRSKIVELVVASDVIFALTLTGVCAAFERENLKRICYLNSSDNELIRSLFHNKLNDSIIHVGVHKSDAFGQLRCRTTPLEYIKRGKPQAGAYLFETEKMSYPGFVEFDDTNGKVLTFVAATRTYKVWDLKSYDFLYQFGDSRLEEIKISPGILLLIFRGEKGHLPLKVLDIHTGRVLQSFKHLIHRTKKIDFIEQFNEKLLVKQEGENLSIFDIKTREVVRVEQSAFVTPNAFIFLHTLNLFLTFRGREIVCWNFRGQPVTHFDDHTLFAAAEAAQNNTGSMCIHPSQEVLVSYCHNKESSEPDAEGSINISNILTGKSIGKICATPGPVDKREREKREALRHITALQYNEARNEIITGNRSGHLFIWSP